MLYNSKNGREPQEKTVCGVIVQRFHFDTIDSTNTWAKLNLSRFTESKIALITADQQTQGRGRFNRLWESPPGVNIYATFVFTLKFPEKQLGYIPMLLGLSAAKVIESYDCYPTIKWPNDLMLNRKKMGGILCESLQNEGDKIIILGIGLNLNMRESSLEKIDQPATSLFIETNHEYPLEEFLEKLTTEFIEKLNGFSDINFSLFRQELMSRAHYKQGDPLCFQDGKRLLLGTYEGIDEAIQLMIKTEDGTILHCQSGEILP